MNPRKQSSFMPKVARDGGLYSSGGHWCVYRACPSYWLEARVRIARSPIAETYTSARHDNDHVLPAPLVLLFVFWRGHTNSLCARWSSARRTRSGSSVGGIWVPWNIEAANACPQCLLVSVPLKTRGPLVTQSWWGSVSFFFRKAHFVGNPYAFAPRFRSALMHLGRFLLDLVGPGVREIAEK